MKIRNRSSKWFSTIVKGAAASAMVVVGLVSFSSVAGANAANPDATTQAVALVNNDGSVTVTMSGTWTWASQADCTSRYGEGWAVDWWGISTDATPANNFTLTNADIVSPPGTLTTASITATGTAPGTLSGGQFFHVSSNLNGEVVNSTSGCTVTPGGITGLWSSTATYPNQQDIPAAICVNMYDLHFAGTDPKTADFDPSSNTDNSIHTNDFDPTTGDGFCSTPQIVTPSDTTTTTKASSPSVTLGSNGTVTDTVTVTGTAAQGKPTGTVAFYVCGPTTANELCASTATPVGTANLPSSGDTGFVSTGTSGSFTPTTPGTYCFAAVFTAAVGTPYHNSSDNQSGNIDNNECFTAAAATSANTGGSTPAATPAATPVAAAAPVAGATVVTTGEPFAGSKGIEAGVALLGMGLLTLGLLRRRSLRRAAEARNG
jgi:hypothetical protein